MSRKQYIDYNQPFTIKELQTALQSINKTSSGIDQITYPMIKALYPSFLTLVLGAFNRIYAELVFPAAWRGRLGVPFIHLFVYISWSYRMEALMLCYNSMAPSTCKDDISASVICHL